MDPKYKNCCLYEMKESNFGSEDEGKNFSAESSKPTVIQDNYLSSETSRCSPSELPRETNSTESLILNLRPSEL